MKRSLTHWLSAVGAALALGLLPSQHAAAQAAKKAQVVILATGGTIAGAGASAANSATYLSRSCWPACPS